jgi:thioredoxin-related protein
MKIFTAFFLLFLAISIIGNSQETINWMSIEEAVEANEIEPKLIFVDVYTNWCGWCKKMDKATFKNPKVEAYMSDKYYCVKINAETKDTINFQGRKFSNPKPEGQKGVHSLARALLDSQMSYPKFVVMNSKFERISIIPGYHGPEDFEPIMKYFGDENHLTSSWEDYKSGFKSSF